MRHKNKTKKLFGFCCIFLSIQIWKKKVHSKVRDTEMLMSNIQIHFVPGNIPYIHAYIFEYSVIYLFFFVCPLKTSLGYCVITYLFCFFSFCVSLTRPRSNPRLWCRWVFPFFLLCFNNVCSWFRKKSQQTSSKIFLINFRYFDAIQGSAPEITAALSPVRAKISTNKALFRSSFSSLY